MEPSYYEVLGVPCDASNAEISRAYQKKVMDDDKGNSTISDWEFAILAEAYEVLIDSETREQYDRENGVRPNTSGDDGYRVSEDAHEPANPRGFSPGRFNRSYFRRMRRDVGEWTHVGGIASFPAGFPSYGYGIGANVPLLQDPPVVRDLRVSLEDVFHGCTKRVTISCKRFNPLLGLLQRVDKMLEVEVERGCKEGASIIFPREGDENPGTIPADVVFILKNLPHDKFTRNGNNIIFCKVISLKESLIGCTVDVPTLEGRVITVQFTDVITPRTEKRLPQLGLPIPGNGNERGDLVVVFAIRFPRRLSDSQKRTLKSLLPS